MSAKSLLFVLRFIAFSLLLALCALLLDTAFGMASRKNGESAAAAPSVSRLRVVIDAGHGGEDGGASSAAGLLEKDVNLDIALDLAGLLRVCGVECTLTREDDRLLYTDYIKGTLKRQDLNARLAAARDNPDAVFLSIHQNTFPDARYGGLQVYYSPNALASADIAKTVQDSVRRLLQPDNERKIKRATSSIFLLHHIQSPALLVECGFLSNVAEAQRLSTESYRRDICAVIGYALCEYFAESSGDNA